MILKTTSTTSTISIPPIREGVGTSNFRTTTGHFFQNVKIVFLVHHYYDITTSKLTKISTTKVVDHYYKNQNVEKNEKNIESLIFV
jgi:hypothetical protein